MLFFMTAIKAQNMECFKLKAPERVFAGTKVFFVGFDNKGDAEFADFGKQLIDRLVACSYAPSKLPSLIWSQSPIYEFVNSADQADVIVTGEYAVKCNKVRDQQDRQAQESSRIQNGLSYTVASYNFKNEVCFSLLMEMKDREGKTLQEYVINDTIVSKKKSDIVMPKITPLEELTNRMLKGKLSKISSSFGISSKFVWVKFLKVSPKDKALKIEYKNVSSLLKNKDFFAAGKIFQKIYNESQNPLAAFNVAVCYEMVGNYAKAAEYYKIKFDFPAKKRMEQNMPIWDILSEVHKVKMPNF